MALSPTLWTLSNTFVPFHIAYSSWQNLEDIPGHQIIEGIRCPHSIVGALGGQAGRARRAGEEAGKECDGGGRTEDLGNFGAIRQ